MENGRCLAAYEYYADGNIKSLRVGTDLITDYAYDLNKNLTTIRTTLGGGSIVCDNRYTYDDNGNRLSKADRQGLTKYAYDANNQLVQVQYPQGGLENYSYDAAGNRLGRSADGIQENYRYDNCNRLIQLTRMTTQQETVTYSYDRQGNMLSDGRNRYAYDDFGRLASTVTAEGDIQKNCYDAEGLRAEMEENGRLVQFLYNEDREVVAEKDYSGNLIRYIRGLGLISSDSENAKTYYHYVCDGQGSVSHIIRGEDKESGVSEQGREQDRILNQYEYDAFGNTISCKEQVENRFRYQGEQYDPITRQYYLRARYYNPVIGRFIQEDTYYGDGLNLYEYCRNNTITYKDPTGHNICATQRDLYHKYKEEGMNPQEAYQKMRKDLGLDSKSGYKDSGVGNGKDPWRSYESGSKTDVTTGLGYDAGDTPVRIDGDWTENDMKQALLGHSPRGLGSPDIHHGGQMPGGALHEVLPGQHRNNPALHPNTYNQGVTPEMRMEDRQLHWWYRAREQGADELLPDWIYD